MYTIYLPKLNNLQPTLDSTLLKAVEEAGELARAVLNFLPYEYKQTSGDLQADVKLKEVSEELLDVAQTCVTMIFVMEDNYDINITELLGAHLAKLKEKGYKFDHKKIYSVTTEGEFKSLHLPKIELSDVTLLTTLCKIQEELGELTQFLGKRAGASGETATLEKSEIMKGCALELLDVAQCCFTMTYILAEKYNVDINRLVRKHIDKLRSKGYCA